MNSPHLLPIIQSLQDFSEVKSSCFGQDLMDNFQEKIEKFRTGFMDLQHYVLGFGIDLRVSWKIHILLNHVQPFVSFHQCGLAKFAEQTGER